MNNWRKAIKKNPRTRNLLKWEKKQAYSNYKKGIAVGLILGAIGVLIFFFIFRGLFG